MKNMDYNLFPSFRRYHNLLVEFFHPFLTSDVREDEHEDGNDEQERHVHGLPGPVVVV